ncbi:cytoplasmic protein [Gregarina niphandrodes]|uniref:Cytoplasmic protein n=1 Tax=Gregarina niphandrodes TaxID=110365 RepID=A0A023BA77_GRENI|nr:cytoplasmic protein [Gregarina niphandrodes]EZG77895.1 cytoplasmic protein [Gregarina niphandrodes]|eukprot:XP_011129472.1 cytoplasmic protein [Gregarina niphandrodes]
MFARLASLVYRRNSIQSPQEEEKPNKERKDYVAAIYAVNGTDVRLLRPRAFLTFSEDPEAETNVDTETETHAEEEQTNTEGQPSPPALYLWDDDDELVVPALPLDQLISVRQHRPDSLQVVQVKPPIEYGFHFPKVEAAIAFRTELMRLLSTTCERELCACEVTVTISVNGEHFPDWERGQEAGTEGDTEGDSGEDPEHGRQQDRGDVSETEYYSAGNPAAEAAAAEAESAAGSPVSAGAGMKGGSEPSGPHRMVIRQRDGDGMTILSIPDVRLFVEMTKDLHLDVTDVAAGKFILWGPFQQREGGWARQWLSVRVVNPRESLNVVVILNRCTGFEERVLLEQFVETDQDNTDPEIVEWDADDAVVVEEDEGPYLDSSEELGETLQEEEEEQAEEPSDEEEARKDVRPIQFKGVASPSMLEDSVLPGDDDEQASSDEASALEDQLSELDGFSKWTDLRTAMESDLKRADGVLTTVPSQDPKNDRKGSSETEELGEDSGGLDCCPDDEENLCGTRAAVEKYSNFRKDSKGESEIDSERDSDSRGRSSDGENYAGSSPCVSGSLRKRSDTRLHKFMEIGEQRSLVCRAKGSASGCDWGRRAERDFNLHVVDNTSNRMSTIKGQKFGYKDTEVNPGKGLLHSNERKLVFVDERNPEDIYQMDLEREKVVSKFHTDGLSAHLLWHSSKGAGSSDDPTFLAASSNAFYLMDTRVCSAKTNVGDHSWRGTTKMYNSKPGFTAAASDAHGHIVLGSQQGMLRLYDGLPNSSDEFKIAKTQLDSHYEKIKAVDTLPDGSWVLATMKNCLILYPTKLRSYQKTGFEMRLGSQKPPPVYLQLKARDIQHYQLDDIEFQPAVFDPKGELIITSVGNLAIIWDFLVIKKGKRLDSYIIKPMESYIQESKIRDDGRVVIAYPSDIEIVNRPKRISG